MYTHRHGTMHKRIKHIYTYTCLYMCLCVDMHVCYSPMLDTSTTPRPRERGPDM